MNIQKVLAASAITYVTLIFLVASATKQGALWRPLKVSHSILLSGASNSGSHEIPSTTNQRSDNTTCSIFCHRVEWCNLWCKDPPSTTTTTCLFFNMYVVVGYQETNLDDALTCFTRSLIDYAVGATIEGAVPFANTPFAVKEYLVDGIYEFGSIATCYAHSGLSDPWFKIDLGSVKSLYQIKMVLHPSSYAQYFYDIEARVGIEDAPPGDFSKYKPFGYFSGPTGPGEVVIFAHKSPIKARYVSVQRWSDPVLCTPTDVSTCRLVVCHIEIN